MFASKNFPLANWWDHQQRQSWKTTTSTYASLATQLARHLARKYRLKQPILDFVVKFQLVFRYETVVFRRYVLSLLLVVLLQKFEAYLVYLSLIWGKFPQCFSCFQKFCHFSHMFPGFPAWIRDMRNRFSALSSMDDSDLQTFACGFKFFSHAEIIKITCIL